MIARLRGRAVASGPAGLVVDVAGVGYFVRATPVVLRQAEAEGELTLETYLLVRGDALQLYGFADAGERELFEQLLLVNGVGPKVALAILSAVSPAELRRAIVLEDSGRFQAIPGIGKKTAQRIVLELKEKLAAGAPAGAPAAGVSSQHLVAREALVGLGYSLLEAERALAPVDPELPAEERIKQALKAA